jgi:hypothetical protein
MDSPSRERLSDTSPPLINHDSSVGPKVICSSSPNSQEMNNELLYLRKYPVCKKYHELDIVFS